MTDCKCEFLIKRYSPNPKLKQHVEYLKPCMIGWPCGKPEREEKP